MFSAALVLLHAAALFNDSHTKPTISRAQATLTLLGCLPASNKRLPFLFRRRKQRSAMLINSGAICFRLTFRYSDFVEHNRVDPGHDFFPCVVSNWDNSPRSGKRAFVLRDPEPGLFSRQLECAVKQVQDRPTGRSLVFLKSWNEWAEGNNLEPDALDGRVRLEVCRDVLVKKTY